MTTVVYKNGNLTTDSRLTMYFEQKFEASEFIDKAKELQNSGNLLEYTAVKVFLTSPFSKINEEGCVTFDVSRGEKVCQFSDANIVSPRGKVLAVGVAGLLNGLIAVYQAKEFTKNWEEFVDFIKDEWHSLAKIVLDSTEDDVKELAELGQVFNLLVVTTEGVYYCLDGDLNKAHFYTKEETSKGVVAIGSGFAQYLVDRFKDEDFETEYKNVLYHFHTGFIETSLDTNDFVHQCSLLDEMTGDNIITFSY